MEHNLKTIKAKLLDGEKYIYGEVLTEIYGEVLTEIELTEKELQNLKQDWIGRDVSVDWIDFVKEILGEEIWVCKSDS